MSLSISYSTFNTKYPPVTIIGAGWLGTALAIQLAKEGATVIATKQNLINCHAMPQQRGVQYYPFQLSDLNIFDQKNLSATQQQYFTNLFQNRVIIFTLPPSAFKTQYQAQCQTQLRSQAQQYGRMALQKEKLLTLTQDLIDNFIALAVRFKAKMLIYSSSISVYGNSSGIIDETLPALPQTESAQICHIIENAFLSQKSSSPQELPIPAVILRLAGLIGAGRHPIYHLSGRKEIKSPCQVINLIHQQDVISAIKTLLIETQLVNKSFLKQNHLYNLVTPYHPTRVRYYEAVAQRLQLPYPHFVEPTPELKKIIDGNLITIETPFNYQWIDLINAPL